MRKLIFILIALYSCKVCETSTVHTTETTVKYKDTTLQGATVISEIPFLVPGEHTVEKHYYVKRDTSGLAELRIYYNAELQKWIAECEAKDRPFKIPEKVIKEYLKTQSVKTVTKIPGWIYMLLGALTLGTLAATAMLLPRIIKKSILPT